ncbi:hypothetical protein QFC21_004615 [Naganishia friedmannii]|uniref:Uncharacterized protein n=1 Tax=Naganishia friedmannii TaxID=89922 RepID=A0ACC2VGS7_9TREE|nr:hypothetical protein QFC21_004615 [Naganishia friedmannii]
MQSPSAETETDWVMIEVDMDEPSEPSDHDDSVRQRITQLALSDADAAVGLSIDDRTESDYVIVAVQQPPQHEMEDTLTLTLTVTASTTTTTTGGRTPEGVADQVTPASCSSTALPTRKFSVRDMGARLFLSWADSFVNFA